MILFGLVAISWGQDQAAQWMQAGNTAYGEKNYDQAITDYQSVLQGNPNYWQAYQGLGNCYAAKGQYNDALTNYQKALDLNPNNPPVASSVQTLRAKVEISVPSPPALDQAASNTNRLSLPSADKVELDFMAGGNLIIGAINPLTNANNVDGETVPFAGGYSIGGGGGVGVYFPLGHNFLIGASAAFYALKADYSYSISGFGASAAVSELFNQSNIEILASAKYRFDQNGSHPYLLGGVGFAQLSMSGAITAVGTEEGVPTESIGVPLPSYSLLCPMVQAGFGVQFPAGNNMDFFVEGKFGFIFIRSTTQTVTYLGETGPYTTPASTFIEFPVDAGLNFNL
jgi:tetratricopeptide (TPR) repeat protein